MATRGWFLTGLLALLLSLSSGSGVRGAPGRSLTAEDALRRAVRLAEAARREVLTEDRCPFSPAGVVLRVGDDPEALAAFVRERIEFEPILGVVRGPRGTLAAGAGGDWDRAVLLKTLLAEAGHASRLLVLSRSPAERAERIDTFLSSTGRGRTLGAAGSVEAVPLAPPAPILAALGVALPNRALDLASGAARWRGLLDEAFDAAVSIAPSIEKALSASGTEIGSPIDTWRSGLLAGAAERVLVEVGGRILDPGPGPSGADARGARECDTPPPDRVARLDLALRMSVAGEGAPEEPTDLLNRSFVVGELYGKSLRIQIVPDGSDAGKSPPNEWTEEEWFERLTSFERFQATLEVDHLWVASDAFDVHGRTFKVKGDGRVEGAKDIGGAVGRGFGGLGGGGSSKPKKPRTRIAALTLELTLRLPGSEPIRSRRLVQGDLRRDVSPVYHTDLVVFGGPSGPESLLWRAFDTSTANVPFVARTLSSDDRYRLVKTGDMRMLHLMLEDWQLARLGLADRLLAADEGLTFLGGPAIAMKTAFLVPDESTRTVRRRTVLDVVHDGMLLLPKEAEATDRAARANLVLGAASTVLESCLVREQRPTAEVRGAYADLEGALARGATPRAVRSPAPGGIEATPLSRWALATESGGTVLVFPSAEAISSWWSIEEATGRTIGRGGGGEGQSMAEYKAAIKTAMKNLKCMLGVFGGKTGAAGSYEWAKCITGFDPAKPSSYVKVVGDYQKATMGLELYSKIADFLGGCEKLVDHARKQGAK